MSGPFADADSTFRRGRDAEAAACRWMTDHGYRVVATNYRTPVGEIDLIADHSGTLCFVEIKARTSPGYGPAVGAVSRRQQLRVARAAALYLQESGWEGDCRFDVMGLEWEGGAWRYDLIQGAFEVA